MGKEFFLSWPLWQKLSLILAGGIVLTIIIGLIKLQYDNHKIRKYTKVEKGKKAQTPEMLEAQPVEPLAPQESKDDVPFGIRAIESGIEVDGVWISRSNTPVGSSASSIRTETKLPLNFNNSQLELPQAFHAGSSRNSSRAPSSFDLAVSAERITTNDSRSSSPGRANARERPTIASSSRQSNPNLGRNSTTLNALEGGEPSSSSARYHPNNSPTHSNSRSSDESDYMNAPEGRPYEPAYINPRHGPATPTTVSADPRWDLNLLQSHRLSHVAETGQLTPRVRRPGHSGEWASTADNYRSPQEVSTANGVDYFVPQQKTPSPPLPAPISPPEAVIPSSSRPNQDARVPPQTRQAMPLLETYAPDAQMYEPEAYQPRGPQYNYEDQFAPRESQVLRKVNSGFEILRPGTLGQPPSPEEGKPVEADGSGEKRQSKRLQKRRKSSSGSQSRTSHFVEQV